MAKAFRPDTPRRTGELGGDIDNADTETTMGELTLEGGGEQGGGEPEEDEIAGGKPEEEEEEACDGGVSMGKDTDSEDDEDKPRTTS